MRQILQRSGRITVESVPAPLLAPGHVLVEVAYSLISTGTELSGLQQASALAEAKAVPERFANLVDRLREHGVRETVDFVRQKLTRPADAGRPVGYSCAGTVVGAGEGVRGLGVGARVACAGAGVANHAELVLVPENLAVAVPEGCSMRAASSVAVGAIALQGVRRADPRLGEIVAVVGLGLIGQIIVELLRAAGCRVAGCDLDERRVARARASGAEVASGPQAFEAEVALLSQGRGADAVIIAAASSSSELVQQAMRLVRKKGRVVVVGAVGLELQRSPFYEKEVDFLIATSYGPGRYDEAYEQQSVDYPYAYVRWTENRNMGEYLRLVGAGAVRFDALVEREVEIGEAPRAYEELAGADKPLAVVLRYPAAPDKTATRVDLRPAVQRGGRVGLAVVGAGSFAASTHFPTLRALGDLFHIRAVVSRTGSRARAAAVQWGGDYATTDLDEALRDPEVDAVLVSTRHDLHAAQAEQALRAGKHVYIEKPLSLDAEGLEKVLAAAGSLVLTVGFNRRFSPAAERLRAAVAKRTGPLVAIYRVNAGHVPPDHWVHGPEGGGRLVGEGCHMVDMLGFLVGAPVESLDVAPLRPRGERTLASDNAIITMRYTDGLIATIVYSSLGDRAAGKELVEVFCDGRLLVLDDYKALRGAEVGWSGAQDKGHKRALERFGKAVREGGPLPIPLDSLEETTRVTLEIGRGLV